MKLHTGMGSNEQNHLTISGCDAVALARQYGTPLYIIDEALVRSNCRAFKQAMHKHLGGGRVMYASKAFMNKAICRVVASEGLGIDVVSGGELFTALEAGISPDLIELHGNNKTPEELEMAIEQNIYRIIIDGFDELDLIEKIAKEKGKKDIPLSIRLRPNIEAHTHEAIQTAKLDCKFGLGILDGQALAAAKRIIGSPYMSLKGIHCHIGSQIFEVSPYGVLMEHFTTFADILRRETGVVLEEFNCGGGFGVWYVGSDDPKSFDAYIEEIATHLHQRCAEINYPVPTVSIEPGRSIIGAAGTTMYTAGGVKEIKGVRTYVSVDGGMFENVRTAMYGSKYTALAAARMDEEHTHKQSIAGKCCESGDMIVWDALLPEIKVGDTLAVLTTGAYNYSMASNYNRNAVPAVVFVKDGKSALAVRRQTYEYIAANDLIPDYLK